MLKCAHFEVCIPLLHISVTKGLRVSPATLVLFDMVNVKHSSPDLFTLSDVIAIGAHWMRASSLNVKLSPSAFKSSVAK